ncbi:MAG: succinate dehydrogenase, cytochrome b556 subunit [Chloroflexi bacterium]|nr:MAG: succinate dehydrogenase, cytochrome b556 subunit [Chloroflexota bacterium]
MSSLKTTANGYIKYRGREGQLSFLLHRVTGLGVLLFLTIHILDTATVYFFPSLYDHAIAIYRTTIFGIGEVFLVFSAIFHGVNGLRIAIFDWFPRLWTIERERRWSATGWILSLVLWLPAAGWMLYNMLRENYGLFGG